MGMWKTPLVSLKTGRKWLADLAFPYQYLSYDAEFPRKNCADSSFVINVKLPFLLRFASLNTLHIPDSVLSWLKVRSESGMLMVQTLTIIPKTLKMERATSLLDVQHLKR